MILVGGENLIDFVQDEDAAGLPRYIANPGGSPYNVAMALGRQGAPIGYLTPISTDSLGDLLASRIEADGVKILSPRAPQPSSLAVVSLNEGVASYGFYRENTAERQVSSDGLAAICPDEVTALHLGSLAVAGDTDGAVWEAFFHARRAAGAFTSLDPNVRPAFVGDRDAYVARIERMAAASDLLKLSDEDLEWLYPEMTQDAAFDHLVQLSGAPLVVLTRGAEGARARSGATQVDVPAGVAAPFTDTVGAGDTFAGTLLAELHRRGAMQTSAVTDMSEDALRSLLSVAAKAAAINCSRSGCQPPTRAELGL